MWAIFMGNIFTKELVENTQSYFLRCHNTRITYEQAELYLHSLSTLYLTFSGVGVVGGDCRPPSPQAGVGDSYQLTPVFAPPDLISPHSCKD
jgi:hypothetical protein